MNTAADNFTHFLGNNASHGMDRLKESAQSLSKIRNSDSISRAQQHDHRLANDAAEPKQHGRDNSRERRRHDYPRNGLQSVCAKRIGSFDKTTRHIAERVLG